MANIRFNDIADVNASKSDRILKYENFGQQHIDHKDTVMVEAALNIESPSKIKYEKFIRAPGLIEYFASGVHLPLSIPDIYHDTIDTVLHRILSQCAKNHENFRKVKIESLTVLIQKELINGRRHIAILDVTEISTTASCNHKARMAALREVMIEDPLFLRHSGINEHCFVDKATYMAGVTEIVVFLPEDIVENPDNYAQALVELEVDQSVNDMIVILKAGSWTPDTLMISVIN